MAARRTKISYRITFQTLTERDLVTASNQIPNKPDSEQRESSLGTTNSRSPKRVCILQVHFDTLPQRG